MSTTGLNYIKLPRNVTEYTLMKGVTDFSNLKQFDLFESGYSFITVVSVPKFMEILGQRDAKVKNLQDGVTHIIEGEFKGLSGIPDITANAGNISNGNNELQLINNVTMDTSIQVDMSFYERSGSLLTNYLTFYLTGIKDPNTKAKTYHGLIEDGIITDPGADYETFTFLYYVTDNTCRKIEKAYLLANAQPTSAPLGTMYNSTKGSIDFQEISLNFNCFPIMGDNVNRYAAMLLQNDLTTNSNRKLILDSNDYKYDVYNSRVENNGKVSNIVTNQTLASTVKNLYKV
nr:MAG TPA: virion structural protein [Caudoviricetes sp.]